MDTPTILEPLQHSQGDGNSASPLGGDLPKVALPVETQFPRLAYSVHEAAAILGVSDKTIRRLITRGLLRPSRALRHLLIPKKEIERFLDQTS